MTQYGQIRLDNILWFEISLLVLIPFYTYYIAVYKDGIAPFPHTTVTDTACPYPQNIVFRFGMLTASSFLAIIFFCMFRWFQYLQKKIQYPATAFPKTLYFIAQMIILPYAITIGTIDGAGTGDIHGVCAVIFFIGLFGLTVYMTCLLRNMRNWDPTIMTCESWFLKRLTCYWVITVAIYCLVELALDGSKGDDMVVIIEWNLVIVNLLWLLSFRSEWKHVYLSFKTESQELFAISE